jgi:hypothetical protein
MRGYWIVGIVLVFAGCNTANVTSNSANVYKNYREDIQLSSLPQYPDYTQQLNELSQPKVTGSVNTIDKELNLVKTRLIEKNKSELYFSGFTILVYSGVDRNQAFKTQSEFNDYFPDLNAEMQYQQPRYLVKVGKYNYKFESQKNFSLIKSQFPSARIIQDRFQREGYVTSPEKDNAQGQN